MALVLLDLKDAKAPIRRFTSRTMNPQNMAAIIGGGSGGFQASKIGRLTSRLEYGYSLRLRRREATAHGQT